MGRYVDYRCAHCLLEARTGPGQMAGYATMSVVCTNRQQIEEVMAECRLDHLEHGPRIREARKRTELPVDEGTGDLEERLARLGISREDFETEYRDCPVCRIGWCRGCGERDHARWTDATCPRCGRAMTALPEDPS